MKLIPTFESVLIREVALQNPSNEFKKLLLSKIPDARFDKSLGSKLKNFILSNLSDFDDEFWDHLYTKYGKLQNVDLRKLCYWQDALSPVGTQRSISPIFVLKFGGIELLTDGYHRVADKLKNDDFEAKAYVLDGKVIEDYMKSDEYLEK